MPEEGIGGFLRLSHNRAAQNDEDENGRKQRKTLRNEQVFGEKVRGEKTAGRPMREDFPGLDRGEFFPGDGKLGKAGVGVLPDLEGFLVLFGCLLRGAIRLVEGGQPEAAERMDQRPFADSRVGRHETFVFGDSLARLALFREYPGREIGLERQVFLLNCHIKDKIHLEGRPFLEHTDRLIVGSPDEKDLPLGEIDGQWDSNPC